MSIHVHVTGTSRAAAKLSEYLCSLGYAVGESGARYTVGIDQATEESAAKISLEGTRGGLAEEIQHAVAELSGAPIEWRRSINPNECHVRLVIGLAHEDAVARGALRAILRLTRHGEQRRSWIMWFERLMGRGTK